MREWDISNTLATKIPKLSHLIHWAIDVDSRSAATFRKIPPTILNDVVQQPNTHSKSLKPEERGFDRKPSNMSVNIEPAHGPALIGDSYIVMTSWNGNIFRATGLLWGKPLVTGGFPSQKPVTRSFDVSFDLCLNKRMRNNRDAGDLRRQRAHYDVTVMCRHIDEQLGVLYMRQYWYHINSITNRSPLLLKQFIGDMGMAN